MSVSEASVRNSHQVPGRFKLSEKSKLICRIILATDSCVLTADSCVLTADSCLLATNSCVLIADSCLLAANSCVLTADSQLLPADSCLRYLPGCTLPLIDEHTVETPFNTNKKFI